MSCQSIEQNPRAPYLLGLAAGGVSLIAAYGGEVLYTFLCGESPAQAGLLAMVDAVCGIHPVAWVAFKVAAIAYLVIIMPIYEEWFFRDLLWIEENSLFRKTVHLTFHAALFGCTRLSVSACAIQNLFSFSMGAVQGVIFGLLREKTGGIKAGITAHMTDRAVSLLYLS